MEVSESERIPCPSCGKSYRWKPELVGRKVACKACGNEFVFPEQLTPAAPPKPPAKPPADDDSLYELASDPDEERELPPAYKVPSTPPKDKPAPPPAPDPADPPESIDADSTTGPGDESDESEPQVHISEAAKAARREELRIARAEEEAIRTWRDFKWLYIAIAAVVLLVILLWAMNKFGDFMKDGVHNTSQLTNDENFAWIDPQIRGD